MKYILAINTGKGFITHEDQEQKGLSFLGYPQDIWIVDGNTTKITSWKNRVSGVEKTKEESQEIINSEKYYDEENNEIFILLP